MLPLIEPPLFSHDKSCIRDALRTGCRSIAVYADAGSFGSPELDVLAGGGQILYLSLGLIWTLGLFASGAEARALRLLAQVAVTVI